MSTSEVTGKHGGPVQVKVENASDFPEDSFGAAALVWVAVALMWGAVEVRDSIVMNTCVQSGASLRQCNARNGDGVGAISRAALGAAQGLDR